VGNNKNIDRLFQENLKDFEVLPPNKAWRSIENKLASPSTKRHIPIWAKISSIAALFVLFFSIGAIYFLPTSNFTKSLLSKNKTITKSSDIKDSIDDSNIGTSTKNTEKTSVLRSLKIDSEPAIAQTQDNIENTEEAISNKTVTPNEKSNRYYLTDALNLPLENNSTDEVINSKLNKSKLTVATIFAPIYINSFGNGSGIDAQFGDNHSSGNSSYSYGVKVAYKLNKKFSVQSGINLINLGYTTNNIYVTPGIAVIGFSHLSSNPILSKNETTSFLDNSNILKENLKTGNETTGSLNQVFGYVEIPVEIKYNVMRGKFDLNLVGGFSTLLLNKDEVFVETNNLTQSLGSSNNLRSINFSGNIGLDVDYSIHKNLFINISPMFKVQTNTFSKNSGSIQPYYLGVYTGLNYKF
jgi:hypothetical protein